MSTCTLLDELDPSFRLLEGIQRTDNERDERAGDESVSRNVNMWR